MPRARNSCCAGSVPQYEDDLNTRLLKGATTLDAFGSWPLTARLQLVARAENLTNALVMAGIGGDGSVERATPRTLWLGIRLSLNCSVREADGSLLHMNQNCEPRPRSRVAKQPFNQETTNGSNQERRFEARIRGDGPGKAARDR